MKVYNAMVVLTMLYDSETWTMVNKYKTLYKGNINGFLRRVESVLKVDTVKSVDVQEGVKPKDVMKKMKRKERAWKAS